MFNLPEEWHYYFLMLNVYLLQCVVDWFNSSACSTNLTSNATNKLICCVMNDMFLGPSFGTASHGPLNRIKGIAQCSGDV